MKVLSKQFNLFTSSSMIAIVLTGCITHQSAPTEIQPITAIATQTNHDSTDEKPLTINVPAKNVVLWDLKLNDQENEIVVKPRSVIQAKINYAYHCSTCYKNLNNQIIVGLAKRSAQACIYDGGADQEGEAIFTLKAPAKPGRYDIRFRGVQSQSCQTALKAVWNDDNSPPKTMTVGVIIASKKALSG